MLLPSEAQKSDQGPPGPHHSDPTQTGIALVQELSEPLAAIENYLEAAICLHEADTPSARIRLGEVFKMSQTEVARVNEILRQLRNLLQQEGGN